MQLERTQRKINSEERIGELEFGKKGSEKGRRKEKRERLLNKKDKQFNLSLFEFWKSWVIERCCGGFVID
jgi:hypothetical protein